MKKFFKFSAIFLFLSIFFLWIFFTKNYFNSVNFSQENFSENQKIEKWIFNKKISVNIKMWTSIKKVAEILEKKWIIESKRYFLIYMKLNHLEWKIQAWDFIFNTPIWLKDLFKQLWNVKKKEFRIIIPEGFTIDDIDRTLAKKWLIEKWDISACAKSCKFPNFNFFYDWNLEWYLFPDTYFVPVKNFTPKNFLERMLRNFKNRVLTDDFKTEYKRQWKPLSDIIKMASIVEREEMNKKNMPIVAWILWKRIKLWIPLWADATTRYFKKSKTWKLYTSDFQANNPYNTRKYKWLPPTAISNPWINAIKAALYPKFTKYLFYLHWTDWQIHYAETNDGHNLNRLKYLK